MSAICTWVGRVASVVFLGSIVMLATGQDSGAVAVVFAISGFLALVGYVAAYLTQPAEDEPES
jgi:hypothetical protein